MENYELEKIPLSFIFYPISSYPYTLSLLSLDLRIHHYIYKIIPSYNNLELTSHSYYVITTIPPFFLLSLVIYIYIYITYIYLSSKI